MLSLRLAIVMSLSAVALWGLFSLLDNLREPELLRSSQAVILKGCEPIESDDAVRLCPQLLCQKALIDSKAVGWQSGFEITLDRRAGQQHLVGGIARAPQVAETYFACVLQGLRVTTARLSDATELAALATQTGEWEL